MTPALASSGWTWVVSGIVCGLGALVAITYLAVSRRGGARQGIWKMESAAAFAKRMRRRRLGAALMAAVSIGVFTGLQVLEPRRWPAGCIIYWMLVLVMLAWLVGLGFIDLLQTRRMFRKPSDQTRDSR